MNSASRRGAHRLLGRRELLETLIQASESEAIVVLKGGPGLGKSALLRALRDEIRGSTSRPVFFARLSETQSEVDLHRALSTGLGFEGAATHEGIVSFLDNLAAPVVLIDELGALSQRAQVALEALLQDCPAATLIAATRHQPALRAYTIEVPPLRTTKNAGEEASPAASLLSWVHRRQLAIPDGQTDTYEAIASALGGVPLAIELAAPRIDALSAQGLLDVLREGDLSMVLGGEQGIAKLVQSACLAAKSATVEAAYLASSCPTGWSLSDLPEVAGVTQSDALRALDASLVCTEREGRISTLPPIGAALRELLPTERARELDVAMAAALVHQAEHLLESIVTVGTAGDQARAFFRHEHTNLEAIAQRSERGELPLPLGAKAALASRRFARVIGGARVDLPSRFVEEPSRSALDSELVAALDLETAMLEARAGALEASFARLSRLRSSVGEGHPLYTQAVHFEVRTSAIRGKRSDLDKQLPVELDQLSLEERIRTLEARAFVLHACEDETLAAAQHREAWREAKKSDNGALRARTSYNLGISLMRVGELSEAKHLFEQSVLEAKRLGIAQFRNVSALAASMIDIALGVDTVSTERLEKLEEAFLKAGDMITRAMVLGCRGDVLFLRRHIIEALHCYEEALPVFEATGWKEGIVSCWVRIGVCARQLGQTARSEHAQAASQDAGRAGTEDDQRAHAIWMSLLTDSAPTDDPHQILAETIPAAFNTRIAARAWLASKSQPQSRQPDLWLSADARVFQLSGRNRRALRANSPMQGILEALARQHLSDPNAVLSESNMFSAGWPGVELDTVSMKRRLSVTLARLRKLGFGRNLEFHEHGYRLSPKLSVLWENGQL